MTDAVGHTTTYTYDPAGNKITETRPDNGTTGFVYDSMNRLTQTTDPKGQVTKLMYDGGNNLVRLTDARDKAYVFTHDLRNQKKKMLYPDASFEEWAFDADGNVTTFKTRSGQVKTNTYDERGRRISSNWSDSTPDVTATFDATGRILTTKSSVSALGFAYDAAGQLVSETQQIISDGGPKSVNYSYDPDGAQAMIGYPSGSSVSFTYDARHHLTGVTSSGISAAYTTDLNGNRASKLLGNGSAVVYTYDDVNRLSTLEHKKSAVSLLKLDYTYNSVNGRTSQTARPGGASPAPRIENYAYDAIDQITNVEYRSGDPVAIDRTVSYNYDSVGNRLSVTDNGAATPYVPNAVNQYTAVDGDAPTYDVQGNLKTQQGWTYAYDAQNRLTSAWSVQSSVTSAYDARNRCVSRTVNGTTTFFYYAGWALIEEQNAAGALIARYVNGLEVDEIIARATPTTTTYYHHDALGSTVALTDGGGNVVETYSYDIFGKPTIKSGTGTVLGTSAFNNRFLFAGRERIPQTALYDYRNRAYSAALGRFLQPDPLGFAGGDSNLYSYVSNSPVGLKDPFGLLSWTIAATNYTYPQFIDRRREVGGRTSVREPEVTADCKCDDCSHQWVLDQLKVKITIDVEYAQGYGSQYRAFVLDTEHQHQDEIRIWAGNDGRNKTQIQEDRLKKNKFTSQEQCKSATSQAALSRIASGLNTAKKKSHAAHDLKGGNHQYDGPLFD